MILQLAIKSLRNRKFTAVLTVWSIALAVLLLLGVERVRQEARESFSSTISGTDLVVGARASPVHLLLYAVFRIGNPTNNLRWESYRAIASRPEVAWSIPISLGDSHRGFRVLATNRDYFEHYRYARDRRLELAHGKAFDDAHDAVLGADVAETLGYGIGATVVIAHGAGEVSFSLHKEHPFRVVGLLARTGTPVDRTVHVTLPGLDAVHEAHDVLAGSDPLAAALRAKDAHDASDSEQIHSGAAHPEPESQRTISAFLLGLKSRGAALSMQRRVNDYSGEPLTAILPGPTLQELWEIVGTVEKTLLVVSVLVVIVGLAGMLVALLTSLSERRREMAILRSVGARPVHIFGLILGEATFLTGCGVVLGIATLYAALFACGSWLQSRLGLAISLSWPSVYEFGLIMLLSAAGVLVGLIPAYRIYRYSLADGMTIRV
jgi:putative ABC transport system permease protein